MSLFPGPEEHAANPPSTWQVVKRTERAWALCDGDGIVMDIFPTKAAAGGAIENSWIRREYEKEGRWYAGEFVAGWRPWADVKNDKVTRLAAEARRKAGL